ncbi:MAG: LysE family transporter [bacterium]
MIMDINWLSLFTFVIITTFTPGPNNLTSAAIGIQDGYKRAIGFTFGVATGFLIIQLISAGLSSSLNNFFQLYHSTFRCIGAIYILWLAIGLFRAKYDMEDESSASKSFFKGIILQFVNPKGIIFGLTLYSTFLLPITQDLLLLIGFSILFSFIALISVTLWALFGAGLKKHLRNERIINIINFILCLLLVYSAVDLSGVFK